MLCVVVVMLMKQTLTPIPKCWYSVTNVLYHLEWVCVIHVTSLVMMLVTRLGGYYTMDFVLQQRFPKFGAARPMSCTIGEGDVLFMPAFWWHEVQSRPSPTQQRNLAVNFW